MKPKVKCWEYLGCNEKECPAYKLKALTCWLISGTHCRNEIQGKFLEKMEMCLECHPFRENIDTSTLEETLKVVNTQFKDFRDMVEERDRELKSISMELAVGLSEVFVALRDISSGDPEVRIPEISELELITKLKHIVNLTAQNLAEIVDLSHEFAIGLAEHFDALHRVSHGDLTARVYGVSQVELLESLKKITNQMIENVSREITERKHAEEALRESEERYRTVLQASPDPVVVYDMEGRGIYINPAFTRVFGWTPEELLGKKINYVPDENWPETQMMIDKVKAGESFSGIESRRYTKEGDILDVNISAANYMSHDGILGGSVHILRDITDRKLVEEALRESRERYRTVLQASPDPIIVYDMEGKGIYINPAFTRVFGWMPEELLGKKTDYVPDQNWPETQMMIDKVLAGESFSGIESRRYTKDGNILDVSISAAIYMNRDATPVGSVHILRDITARKRAEEALRKSQEEYSTLVENSLTGIYIDQGGKIVFANKRFADIYGYSRDELLGMKSSRLVHPEDRALTDEIRAKRLRGEKAPSDYDARALTKDGETIWIKRRNTRIEYNGTPAVLGNIVDITKGKRAEEALRKAHDELELRVKERTAALTKANEQLKREIEERKRAQEELKVSEEKYRLLFSYDPNPLFLVDIGSSKILDANKPATVTYQYERQELLEMSFLDLFDAEEGGRLWNELEDSHKDVYVFIPRASAKKKDGRYFFIHLHASAVRFPEPENGDLGRSLIVRTVDITQRLEREALFAQAGKMATLGEMATGVAHELNQPLNVIQVGTDFLTKMTKRGKKISDDELLTVSRNISEQVKRATNIVDHLREFGRKSDLELHPVDLNEPIRGVFTLLGQQLKLRNIEVNLNLEEGLPKILAEKNRLEQIFLNLISNARDAIVAKGPEATKELTVTTFQQGDSVVGTVSDTGTGMSEAIRKKVFDPFFTTKEAGKGTGLGLSIIYNLVKDFKGDIDVESVLDVGTTFKIRFPVYKE